MSTDFSSPHFHPRRSGAIIALLIIAALACSRSALPGGQADWLVPAAQETAAQSNSALTGVTPLPTKFVPGPRYTPTPDSPHAIPTLRSEPEQYVVQPGDTLGEIANKYGVQVEALVSSNQLVNPNILEIGQLLTVPVATPGSPAPDFKIIPDSELVYSPVNMDFDLAGFIQAQGGYLSGYREEIGETTYSGIEIIQRVALDYSVNPRLLLAVLEYQSGWVTETSPPDATLEYPIGVVGYNREGLYHQMTWAANMLNQGFYLWRVNGVASWLLSDGSLVVVNPTVNAGTAGVQQFFAPLYDRADWQQAVSPEGLSSTYENLFGFPFTYVLEPLVPTSLAQPPMQLPFESGQPWAFTGGPHGGWGNGSAWAALDFAPQAEALGCILSDEWVVAVADGLITRAADGAVIQDLDGDGKEQTGWVVLYMHIESRDRVQPGAYLYAGERIGHPSCEGGVSSGTHVHIARKYNGEWIPADQSLPFVLDGWISRGTGNLYDGFLERDGNAIEAWEGLSPENTIQR